MHRFLYLGLALIVCSCFDARAATFIVTRQDDPAPNGCNPGDCSLREAVNAANSNSALGPRDIIQLAGVTYTLTAGVLAEGIPRSAAAPAAAQASRPQCGSTTTEPMRLSTSHARTCSRSL